MESPASKGSVEQIKVEPDFYFPTADSFGLGDDGDGDEDDLGEEQLEMHEIDLDSPVKQKIHTGEKPFQCKLCYLRFTQSCNLQSHYRRNHGVDPRVNPQLFAKLRQQSIGTSSSAMVSRPSTSWSPAATALPKLTPKPAMNRPTQPFQCCVCEEPFFDRDLLLIHEETHVPEAPFECRYCTTRFNLLPNFRSHVNIHRISMKTTDNANQALRQSQSGIRIYPNGPVATRRVAPQPTAEATGTNTVLNPNRPFVSSNDPEYPYKCVECKKNFQKHELYYHMKVHLKQKNIFSKKSLKCDKCGKVFEKELTLKKHMDAAHPTVSSASGDNTLLLEALQTDAMSISPLTIKAGTVQLSSEVELVPIDVIKQEPESTLGDDEVNSTVSDNPILTQLLNTTSELPVSSNGGTRDGTPVNASESELSTEGGFVISAVATVDHSFLEQLDQLERIQQQPTPQPQEAQPMPALRRMPVLEESLRRPPVVQNNTPTTRPLNSGPYRCSFCQKLFNEHFGLRQHIRAMHYAEKRYKCKECNKKFTLGITLATHLRIHTAVQPFTCIVCYKTFTRSTSLNGHLSSHSYGRVKCAECGESQINVFNYMKHIEKFHPNFLDNVTSYRQKAEAMLQRRRELVLEITRGLAKHRSEIPNVLARLRGEIPANEISSANNKSTVPKLQILVKQEKNNHDEDSAQEEVSSSEEVLVKKEKAYSEQSEVVSSASEEQEASSSVGQEALPALRAELRKRPLRSNTRSNDLEDLVLPPPRKSTRISAGSLSPNLKRLLEQTSPSVNDDSPRLDTPPAPAVKSEPSE